jgi:hypothetical protein
VIYVFSPRIIEKVTVHNKEIIPGTIFHELIHIIYKQMNFINVNLFFEGVATYLTQKYEMKKEIKNDIDLSNIKFEDYPKFSKKVYSDGFKVVSKIIEKYGKKELMNFLKYSKNEKQAESIFKNKFGKKI